LPQLFSFFANGFPFPADYHEKFLRGSADLAKAMTRTCIKGRWIRQASSPGTEPDFYRMEPVRTSSPLASLNNSNSSCAIYSSMRPEIAASIDPKSMISTIPPNYLAPEALSPISLHVQATGETGRNNNNSESSSSVYAQASALHKSYIPEPIPISSMMTLEKFSSNTNYLDIFSGASTPLEGAEIERLLSDFDLECDDALLL
jgi:hypothetical protein